MRRLAPQASLMQTIDQLNASFAIPGILSFDEHGSLIRARISTPACNGELYLQGAHITAWQPANEQPVLFLSEKSAFAPGKAIRGGIPIIFPWFGPRTATPENPRTDGPAHGFARTQPWKLDFGAYAADELHLSLSLEPTELSRSLGFDNFLVAYQITFGKELKLRLSVANDGNEPLPFEEALHTYLQVGDVEQARVHGLYETEYLDKTDNFARKTQTEPILTFAGPTDRPYLNTTSPIAVDDPALHRRITVTKANSKTTVVWNPWANAGLPDMADDGWLHMLCIESANAAEDALRLQPHEAHVMETTISVEALA
jgi:glucose-6-phosphate 1-epimerase